jgi:hypothetical protein
MILIADLEDFVHDHRFHGSMIADATPPAWNGYLLTVACPCGVVLRDGSRLRMPSWTSFGPRP